MSLETKIVSAADEALILAPLQTLKLMLFYSFENKHLQILLINQFEHFYQWWGIFPGFDPSLLGIWWEYWFPAPVFFTLLHTSPPQRPQVHISGAQTALDRQLFCSLIDWMWACEGRQWGVKADTRCVNCSDLFWWFTYLVSVSASLPWGQRGSETQDPTQLLLPPSVGKKRIPFLLYVCKKNWSDLEVWSYLDIFSYSVKRKLPESRNGNRQDLYRGTYWTVSFNLCDSLLIKS